MVQAYTYIEAIGEGFPAVKVECINDGSIYEDIVWVSGDPLPSKNDLDAWLLVKAQSQMWGLIKGERDRRRTSGVFVDNHWFHTNDSSRIQYLGLLMMGALMPADISWKTMSNEFVPMTPALANQIFQVIASSDTAIFEIAEQKKVLMMLSLTPLTFDYLSGWPLIFGE